MAEEPEEEKLEPVHKIRADFMRRWFAIAISVGFATTVVKMPWVESGDTPNYQQAEQLARLGVALLATILSWEGYLLSIRTKRLEDIWRYFIDVFLVFLYLFLLLTSGLPHFWLSLHALSFGLYMLWDFLTICWYRENYAPSAPETSVARVYIGSLIGAKGIDRGPIITILWALYFLSLYLSYPGGVNHPTFVFAGFVFLGLCGYRLNKQSFRDDPWVTFLAPATLIIAIMLLTRLL